MQFKIYQLKRDQRYEYSFMRWSFAKEHGFSTTDYDQIYAGERQDSNYLLEELWEEFNINHPADFKGHSLSVSDIVALGTDDNIKYYYCDSFGWKDITDVIRKESNGTTNKT